MSFIRFLMQKNWIRFVSIVVLIGVAGFIKWSPDINITGSYNNFISPIVGVITLFFAFFIWYINQKDKWEKNLSKLLTVRFVYKDTENKSEVLVMLCVNASLPHESDIRNWGQQIGRQMNKNLSLDFYPNIKYTTSKPKKIGDKHYKPYYSEIILFNKPSIYREGEYRLWYIDVKKNSFNDESYVEIPNRLPVLEKSDEIPLSTL